MDARIELLLEHLRSVLSIEKQAEIDDLYARTLSWQPVKRLALILQYPHSEIYSCPEKMLFNVIR